MKMNATALQTIGAFLRISTHPRV